MRAVQIKAAGEQPEIVDVLTPKQGRKDCLIKMEASGLNHRDVYIRDQLYPGIEYPVTPGSDGVGILSGRRVLLNPSLNWKDDPKVQPKDYQILGMPTSGTMAEYTVVPKELVHDCPAHLSPTEAAALPLAGLTAYRALFSRGKLMKGEKILISGVGGGVALFAMQFAVAAGAQVYVTSSSNWKIQKAQNLGALDGLDYLQRGWGKKIAKATGGFDLVIDSAGGPGFKEIMDACAPGARIVMYGGTRGSIPKFSPQLLFWKQISLLGSTMGNATEFASMLSFVAFHNIKPIVDRVYPVEQVVEAFDYLASGKQFGKVVLEW